MDRVGPRRLALVIDDVADTREVYALVFALEGCLVAQARDGHDGFQKARVLVPDIIIVDLTMPVMDGWETIRRLRGDSRTRNIPIIACSGHDARQRMGGVVPDGLLAKPCPVDMLVAEVRRFLQRAA